MTSSPTGEPERPDVATGQGNRHARSTLGDIGRVINFVSDAKELFGWLIVGPVLIVLGVTQAIYGWAGDSPRMRLGYSAACILFGLLLTSVIIWLLIPDDEVESEVDKQSGSDRQDDER